MQGADFSASLFNDSFLLAFYAMIANLRIRMQQAVKFFLDNMKSV